MACRERNGGREGPTPLQSAFKHMKAGAWEIAVESACWEKCEIRKLIYLPFHNPQDGLHKIHEITQSLKTH